MIFIAKECAHVKPLICYAVSGREFQLSGFYQQKRSFEIGTTLTTVFVSKNNKCINGN